MKNIPVILSAAKNLHRRRSFTALRMTLLACALIASPAYAQKIRDMSLSETDSMRQPNRTGDPYNPAPGGSGTSGGIGGVGNAYSTTPYGSTGNSPYGTNAAAGVVPPGDPRAATGRYMDGYCDPNVRPGIAMRGQSYINVQACVEKQRQDVCEQFTHLNAEVQKVIDDAITCEDANQNGAAPADSAYGAQFLSSSKAVNDCGQFSAARLELLRKYWSDTYAPYALAFMPETVLYGGANCLKSGGAR